MKAADEEVNFCDLGIELTRGFRALKLWLTIQLVGLDNFRAAIAKGIAMAELAESRLRATARFEITSPAQLGIVSFRYLPENHPDANAFQLALSKAVIEDGFAFEISALLDNR